MFVRIKHVQSGDRSYRYLQIVENYRESGRVRQRCLGNLGRLDQLIESGDLERVARQLVEHCPTLRIAEAQARGDLEVESDRLWGPVLVFERLWEELGLRSLLPKLLGERKLEFDFERMIFVQAFQRLIAPGSDLSGSKWLETIEGDGFSKLRLQHFYRSLDILWSMKDGVEVGLHRRGLDLFNQDLDLVFFYTTSTYFEGTSLEGLAKLGKSKDHRPDHLQIVIGVLMRGDGTPIS